MTLNEPRKPLIKGWVVPNNQEINSLAFKDPGNQGVICARCGHSYCMCCVGQRCPKCKSKLIVLMKAELEPSKPELEYEMVDCFNCHGMGCGLCERTGKMKYYKGKHYKKPVPPNTPSTAGNEDLGRSSCDGASPSKGDSSLGNGKGSGKKENGE